MNKAELADVIAQKIGISKKQAEETLELITETITTTINQGGEVTLTGFGTFSARERKGRIGVNPRKPSEKITIPNVKVPKFKAGKNLKDTLKGKRK
jgi:DNA-binding protein HU-beta